MRRGGGGARRRCHAVGGAYPADLPADGRRAPGKPGSCPDGFGPVAARRRGSRRRAPGFHIPGGRRLPPGRREQADQGAAQGDGGRRDGSRRTPAGRPCVGRAPRRGGDAAAAGGGRARLRRGGGALRRGGRPDGRAGLLRGPRDRARALQGTPFPGLDAADRRHGGHVRAALRRLRLLQWGLRRPVGPTRAATRRGAVGGRGGPCGLFRRAGGRDGVPCAPLRGRGNVRGGLGLPPGELRQVLAFVQDVYCRERGMRGRAGVAAPDCGGERRLPLRPPPASRR